MAHDALYSLFLCSIEMENPTNLCPLEISVSMRLSSPGVDPDFGKPVVFEQNVLVKILN